MLPHIQAERGVSQKQDIGVVYNAGIAAIQTTNGSGKVKRTLAHQFLIQDLAIRSILLISIELQFATKRQTSEALRAYEVGDRGERDIATMVQIERRRI